MMEETLTIFNFGSFLQSHESLSLYDNILVRCAIIFTEKYNPLYMFGNHHFKFTPSTTSHTPLLEEQTQTYITDQTIFMLLFTFRYLPWIDVV